MCYEQSYFCFCQSMLKVQCKKAEGFHSLWSQSPLPESLSKDWDQPGATAYHTTQFILADLLLMDFVTANRTNH